MRGENALSKLRADVAPPEKLFARRPPGNLATEKKRAYVRTLLNVFDVRRRHALPGAIDGQPPPPPPPRLTDEDTARIAS